MAIFNTIQTKKRIAYFFFCTERKLQAKARAMKLQEEEERQEATLRAAAAARGNGEDKNKGVFKHHANCLRPDMHHRYIVAEHILLRDEREWRPSSCCGEINDQWERVMAFFMLWGLESNDQWETVTAFFMLRGKHRSMVTLLWSWHSVWPRQLFS